MLRLGLVAGVIVLASCSATQNYQRQTEEFLNGDAAVEEAVGGDVSGAECAEPETASPGEFYACRVDVVDQGEIWFIAEVLDRNEFSVTPQSLGLVPYPESLAPSG